MMNQIVSVGISNIRKQYAVRLFYVIGPLFAQELVKFFSISKKPAVILSAILRSSCALNHPRLQILSLLLIAISLSGCVTTSTPQRLPEIYNQIPAQDSLGAQLRNTANDWAGTPHLWGGTSREGIDCSAFVQTVYKDLFNLDIPRTTLLQSKEGDSVPLQNLQTGDLVFYRIDSRTRHVGIYVGDEEFMHASKSQGVTISSLNDPYWSRRFWTVRRILEPAEAASETVTNSAEKKGKSITW